MKKYLLILTMVLGGFSFAKAQDLQGDEQDGQKKIQALYVAYVTERLKLTPDEAQKFWPVHTQFENDLKAVDRSQSELKVQQAVLDVKKKYQDNFSRIIGTSRCDLFFKLSGEFKQRLIEARKQRLQNQRPRIRRGL